MISLKKHIDDWTASGSDPVLSAYRSLIQTVARCSYRAVPALGRALEQKLSDLNSALDEPETERELTGALVTTDQRVRTEISEWAEQAFARNKSNEKELRDIVEAMAKVVESITERDERFKLEVGDLTERLRSITSLSDLGAIRLSIVESANSLASCVERMADAGRESVRRLTAEVEEYRARLDKSERISLLDALTGLANRRRFEQQLDSKIHARSRFCLILVDLDDFKGVNDRLGHLAGDEVLKSFAHQLRKQFPSADLIARWGGDEFAVIINSARNDVEARVDRIRRSSIGECRIKSGKRYVTVEVECSIGVVEWDGSEDKKELMSRADNSMYLHKNSVKSLRAC